MTCGNIGITGSFYVVLVLVYCDPNITINSGTMWALFDKLILQKKVPAVCGTPRFAIMFPRASRNGTFLI